MEFKSICFSEEDGVIVINKHGFLDYSYDNGLKKVEGNIVMSKQLGLDLVEVLTEIHNTIGNEINFIKKSTKMMNN